MISKTRCTIYVFLGSSYQNAQKMYALYKQFDKNGDGKITSEDIEIYLQEMGLGFVSPCEY
jgi:Ca2+-binding EF-hand superfamily protein